MDFLHSGSASRGRFSQASEHFLALACLVFIVVYVSERKVARMGPMDHGKGELLLVDGGTRVDSRVWLRGRADAHGRRPWKRFCHLSSITSMRIRGTASVLICWSVYLSAEDLCGEKRTLPLRRDQLTSYQPNHPNL